MPEVKTTRNFQCVAMSQCHQTVTGNTLTLVDHFHYEKDNVWWLLEKILPLSIDFPFLNKEFLPKLQFRNLKNALSFIMLFCAVWFITRQHTSQKSWVNGCSCNSFSHYILHSPQVAGFMQQFNGLSLLLLL